MRATLLALLLVASPALALTNPVAERTSPTSLDIRWTGNNPVDVLVSDNADAAPDAATVVSRADKDGHHSIEAGIRDRRYILLRDTKTGETLRVAERLVPLEQGSNFRDIGGYPAADGRHVRWGRLYRSGGQPLLTDDDVAEIQSLGLKNMVDLRSMEERQLAPSRVTGVPYTAIGYSMRALMPASAAPIQNGGTVYRNFPTLLAPQLRLIVDRLLADDAPLAYNCSAGQDRTGFVTAMLLSALGVPRDVILADYHLSTALRRPENEMAKITPEAAAANPVAAMFARYQTPAAAKPTPLKDADGRAFLEAAFDEIETRYGSVDAYLEKAAGLTPAARALLRAKYLE
jgi:protein-tyrosine phosphatase